MADKKISALTAATTPLAGTEVLPIVQGGATVKVAVSNLTAGRTTNAFQYTSTVSEASQQAISCISANLNTVVTNGSYAGYSATNAPESTAAWIFLTVTSNGTDQIYQTCAIAGYVNGQTYKRFSADSGASWTSWVLISANTTGNIAFASGNGIDFSATSGTGTSELLADYEEGTWTPTLAFGGGSTGITYSAGRRGLYTKTGNTVVVNAILELTSKGSSTGTAVLSGLPFTSNQYINYVGVSALYGNITVLGTIQPLLVGNTTNINLYEVTATGGTTQLDNTDFANNSYVYISFSYQV